MIALYVYAQMAFSALGDRFEEKTKGATAVEYGIMVAAIAVAIIVAVFALGGQIKGLFEGAKTAIAKGTATP